jgi:hypothetical protein
MNTKGSESPVNTEDDTTTKDNKNIGKTGEREECEICR